MDTIERGEHAQRLLDDPVLSEAFELAGASFIRDWMNGETTEEREEAHHKQAALAEVEKALRIFVSEAVAEVENARRQQQSEN